ncbi:MAG: ATP-binding protein [Pirellulales bacterium]
MNLKAPERNEERIAQRLVRTLARRYSLALLLVIALVGIDQAIIQPKLVRLSFYAPVINVAGRQRMLSQKVAKTSLTLLTSSGDIETRQQQLREALQHWSAAHDGLLHGDVEQELFGTTSPEIVAAFAELQPHFDAMRTAATRLAGGSVAATEREQLVDELLRHEVAYLPIMDRIVGMFEAEARQRVTWLRRAGIFLMLAIVLSMTSIAYLVIRPANEAIKHHVEQLAEAHAELEQRVDERTRELSVANQALESEMAERTQAESRSKQLASQLAHASRVTVAGELATGIAHELNQPLAAISNYANACELQLEAAGAAFEVRHRLMRHLSQIRASALRAGAIIRRMRNFLRPEQDPELDEVAPQGLLNEVCELCGTELTRTNVPLHLNIEPDLPNVRVDAIQIQQVLANLIQNAVRSMEEIDAGRRELTIRCARQEHSIRFEVLDRGIGFAEIDPDELFKAFRSTRRDGLGMGLAISRTIVESHGGRIWAENRRGGGAKVVFTLALVAGSGCHAA